MAFEGVGAIIGGGTGDTVLMVLLIVGIGGAALLLAGGGFCYYYFKKRWNLRVEIKLPRSDGRIVNGEWGKGHYDAKKGVVFIKRKGIRSKQVPMKTFDVRKYLQGTDLLTVIQLTPEVYLPVLNNSYTKYEQEYIDDETGKKTIQQEAIMNIRIDTGKTKAWRAAWEAAAKKAYSIQSFLTQFQTPIAIGIVILCCFVGFAIIWARLPSIC